MTNLHPHRPERFRRVTILACARRFFSRSREGQQGVAAVEMALISPFYVFMLISTFDYGMGIYRDLQVQQAAQAGAMYAMSHGFTSGISNAVTTAAPYAGIAASPAPVEFCGCPSSTGVVTATCNSTCSNGETAGSYVTVDASATYMTLISYPGVPSSFAFSAQSTVRIQ